MCTFAKKLRKTHTRTNDIELNRHFITAKVQFTKSHQSTINHTRTIYNLLAHGCGSRYLLVIFIACMQFKLIYYIASWKKKGNYSLRWWCEWKSMLTYYSYCIIMLPAILYIQNAQWFGWLNTPIRIIVVVSLWINTYKCNCCHRYALEDTHSTIILYELLLY